MSRQRPPFRKAIWFGFALSAFFLWLVLRNVDVPALKSAFISLNYYAVVACGAAVALGMFFRAVRWRVIANSPGATHSIFSRATNIGVLGNLIFPGRAGEVIRILTLSKLLSCPLSRAVASAMIDRFIDVLILIFSALVIYIYIPAAVILKGWLMILGSVCMIIITFVGFVVWRPDLCRKWGRAWLQRILRQWALRPEAFLSELFRDLKSLAHGRLPGMLFGLSVTILCLDYTVIASALVSLHLSLPVEAPLLLWVFLAAASALPSAPGYVGVYQIAAIWALSLYDVSATRAVAVALVLQLTTLLVAVLMASPILAGFILRKKPLQDHALSRRVD